MNLRFEKKVGEDWHHIQTIEISVDEWQLLVNYCATHNQVYGFYKYQFDNITYHTCVSYLLDYVKVTQRK